MNEKPIRQKKTEGLSVTVYVADAQHAFDKAQQQIMGTNVHLVLPRAVYNLTHMLMQRYYDRTDGLDMNSRMNEQNFRLAALGAFDALLRNEEQGVIARQSTIAVEVYR